MDPLNQQKIDKIQAWTSQGPSLCPPLSQDRPRIVPGSPQDRPKVPQDAKVEAPSMPNDTHGHHKPEIWSQKCQESGNQEPASQHTFQQSQGGRRQGRSRKIIKLRTSTSGSSTQPPSSNVDIRHKNSLCARINYVSWQIDTAKVSHTPL